MSGKRPLSQRVDLYTWRTAIASKDGPPHPQTRHVLLTLSAHMRGQGENCWPSQRLLAERAGLHERVVRRHLKNADDQGWLTREAHRRPRGQNWKFHSYGPAVPVQVLGVLPAAPWANTSERTPAKGADTVSGPSPDQGKVRTGRTKGPDRTDKRSGQSGQKVRTEGPLNPFLNPSVNPFRECAPHNPESEKEVQREKTIAEIDLGADAICLCQRARPGADPLDVLRKFRAWGQGKPANDWQRSLQTFAINERLSDDETRAEQRAIYNKTGPRKPGESAAEYVRRTADPPTDPRVAKAISEARL